MYIVYITFILYYTKVPPGRTGRERMFVLFVKKKLADIANFSKGGNKMKKILVE